VVVPGGQGLVAASPGEPSGSGAGRARKGEQPGGLGTVSGVIPGNCDIAPLISLEVQAQFVGPAVRPEIATPLGVMPYAIDPGTANRLWSVSEELL
jgi:hypothetical protein